MSIKTKFAALALATLAITGTIASTTQAQAKKNIVKAIETVAERLGNTPAVCRKCYVHPDVINAYMDGTLIETLKQRAEKQLSESLSSLRPQEAAVLGLLQQRLALETKRNRPLPELLKGSLAKHNQ